MEIKDNNEFSPLMDEIDGRLSQEEMPIYQRPIPAFTKLANMIDPKGSFPMTESSAQNANDFSNMAIWWQVSEWYRNKYGNRVKFHPGPGHYILIIRGEPWKANLPLCYGSVTFVCDRKLSKQQESSPKITKSRICNVLEQIEDMSESFATTLTDNELDNLIRSFVTGLNQIQELRNVSGQPFMKQAGSDYDTAINLIFDKNPNYPSSKWASLQFAEKTIKSKLESNKVVSPKTHDLHQLNVLLQPLGVILPTNTLKAVQCDAGVRYGSVPVTKAEAILALQKAVEIFDLIFQPSAYELTPRF